VKLAEFLSYDPKAVEPGLTPNPIPWPTGLAPVPVQTSAVDTDPLPRADVLVVTYTVAEGQALADVLTPGFESSAWTSYRNNWPALKALVAFPGPSLHSNRAGIWAVTQIGDLKVVLVKSDLHPSTDGPKLPMVPLWQQMIKQVKPKLVITTGTAGGIGASTNLGDVIVSPKVRWDATTKFKSQPWAKKSYTSRNGKKLITSAAPHLEVAQQLFAANAGHLPAGPVPAVINGDVITTDFFAFDDLSDAYGLRKFDGTARAVEMDDAALGLACTQLSHRPVWVSARNASDPEMNGSSLAVEDKAAAAIYRKYGYWTTVNSAVVCWALIAASQ
jgi:nucleoside phosphorylase